VGKLFGWTHQQINDPANIQILSEVCHRFKDHETQQRVNLLREQLQEDREVTLEDLQTMFTQVYLETWDSSGMDIEFLPGD